MKNSLILLSILLLFGVCANGEMKNDNFIHQNINVNIDVVQSKIQVDNSINLPKSNLSGSEQLHFYLNKNLVIDSCNYQLIEQRIDDRTSSWKKYSISNKSILLGSNLYLKYHGEIADQKEMLSAPPKHGARKETSGIVFEKGIYLSGATAWVPRFDMGPLVTFELSANVDADWNVVAQGKEVSNEIVDNRRRVVYRSDKPTNQIYLLGNKWTEYRSQSGDVLVQAYLIKPDEKLANKYLEATAKYLQMYEKLIGKYPYSKFAMVENFWETGYGMPSFTLLGQRVIRMPWIINSSYPHELLHNYWGNGVFVDYSKGNWSEGITTYMADHLLKEMKGQGAEYRQKALQKYSSYVNAENDFPVIDFKSRTTKASSAIGYDKVVMMNHMLRMKYGEENFLKSYADFYKSNRFTKASFDEIQSSFEKITGDDLSSFFYQWINRTGVPEIAIENVKQADKAGINKLSFTISQSQNEDVFVFDLPILIYQEGKADVVRKTLTVDKCSKEFTFDFNSKIERIEFDPAFDVMRKLDSREVAVTVSGLLGAQKCVLILPSKNPNLSDFQAMTKSFKMSMMRQRKQVTILMDNELELLPNSEYIWVLGADNKFASSAQLGSELKGCLSKEAQEEMESNKGSLFYIQTVDEQHIAFLDSKNTKQLTQVLRKMGHYGSYSYLGFDGEQIKNTLKGVFPILHSPMTFSLDKSFDSSLYNTKEKKRSLMGEIE